MTATSAASTLKDSWNRLPDCNKSLKRQAMPAGVKFSPPSLATLDRPQRKVLLVVDNAIIALDLQRLLGEAGYRVVGPATMAAEIQRIVQRGDIDCAILDLDVDRRAPLPVADLLAFADVPFVYLTTGAFGPRPARHSRRPVVEMPFTREILLAAVESALASPREVVTHNQLSASRSVVPWTRVYPQL